MIAGTISHVKLPFYSSMMGISTLVCWWVSSYVLFYWGMLSNLGFPLPLLLPLPPDHPLLFDHDCFRLAQVPGCRAERPPWWCAHLWHNDRLLCSPKTNIKLDMFKEFDTSLLKWENFWTWNKLFNMQIVGECDFNIGNENCKTETQWHTLK